MQYTLFCAALLLVTAPAAKAETVYKPKIVVHGDVSIPVEPSEFSDGFSVGLGGGIGIAFPLASRFAIVADVDYKVFGIDEAGFRQAHGIPPGVSLTGDQLQALYASLAIKIDLVTAPSQVRPYLIGGGGYFRLNPEAFAADGTSLGFESENTLGAHGGGGLEIVLAPYLILFLDAVYVVGFTESEHTSYVSIRPGVAFDWKAQD